MKELLTGHFYGYSLEEWKEKTEQKIPPLNESRIQQEQTIKKAALRTFDADNASLDSKSSSNYHIFILTSTNKMVSTIISALQQEGIFVSNADQYDCNSITDKTGTFIYCICR